MSNPWITIWTEPRETIRKIVAENPNRSLWLLAFIYGFSSLLNLSQSMVLGSVLGTFGILLFVLILAPFWGYLNFSIWSFLIVWVGKLFKGKGNFKAVRAAYSWSCVPITLNIPLWLLMVMLFGHQLFLNFPEAHFLPTSQVIFLFVVLISKVILSIWSLVIYVNALSEVQQFSILRSILTVVVAGLVFSVMIFLLWSLLIILAGGAN